MRAALWPLLSLLLPSLVGAENGVSARLEGVKLLLHQGQIEQAVTVADALYSAFPDIAPVQMVAGRVKFYQGDYRGAVTILERAVAAYDQEQNQEPALLAMSRNALELTKDYKTYESEHFILRTPKGKDELLALYAIDALEQAYTRLGRVFDYHPKRKILVEVLPSSQALAQVSPLTVEAIETSGTIALSKYGRLLITSPKALWRGYPWLDTLAHEYIHLLVSERTNNSVPVWLHEGLAKYFETAWRGEPGQALNPGGERLLAEGVKANKLITFAQMHPSMAMLPTQQDTALAFAEVFTVVEYLQAQHGATAIGQILQRMQGGETEDVAIAHVSGSSFERFVADWKSYLRDRPYNLVPGAQPEKLVFKKQGARDDRDADLPEKGLDKQAKKWVRLGGILRSAGRPKAAAVEYQRAVDRVGVRAPHLYNRLAATYIDSKDLKRARTTLEAALAPLPDDPQTHILLGRVAMSEQRYQDAQRSYLKANQVHPFHPEIHASLYTIARKLGDKQAEEREKKAIAFIYNQAVAEAAKASAIVAGDTSEAGFLTLQAKPCARVLIDGDDLGLWTPLLELPLRPGSYVLTLQNSAFGVNQEITVTIKKGETTSITRDLQKP